MTAENRGIRVILAVFYRAIVVLHSSTIKGVGRKKEKVGLAESRKLKVESLGVRN